MVSFLREYSIDYVQTVHSDDVYGRDGAAVFTNLAVSRGICVTQRLTVNTTGDLSITVNTAVNQLMSRSNATVVIVFLSADYILPFLQAVQRNTVVKVATTSIQ